MHKKILWIIPGLALIPKAAFAHCPLCTVGAGALAVLATSLGVSSVVVGIMIGAFSLALGLWIAPMVKKQFVPYQKHILTLLIFLGTVIPIMPLIRDYGPFYISLSGEYGTLLHNTYTINLFILGVVIGAVIMLISPYISKALTRIRGQQIPYQGIAITLALLIVASIIVQMLP
jgi:hypothetical protein